MSGSLLQRRPDLGDRAAGALLGLAVGAHQAGGRQVEATLEGLVSTAEAVAHGPPDVGDLAAPGGDAARALAVTVPLALAHLHDEAALGRAARDLTAAQRLDEPVGDDVVRWGLAVRRAVRDARPDGVLARVSGQRRALTAADLGPLVLAAASRPDAALAAPLVGALAGGRWGATAVPFAPRRSLDRRVPRLAGRLSRLAMLAANSGRAVEEAWPLVPMLAGPRLGQAPFLCELAEDPGVVLGNLAALPQAVADVDAVVSLCLVDPGEVPDRVEHLEVALLDRADAAANPNLSLVLADTAAAIAVLRDEGRRVLVHCLAGRSRTPTVVAAYLARRAGLSGREAFARVAAQVPHPDPLNRAFQEALARIPGPEG